jgi:hypothetical protein
MASKRRIRRKMCVGKKRHRDLKGAQIHIKVCGYQGVMAYHCKFCGFYHVGHPPAKIRAAINQRKLFHKYGDITD